MSTSEVNENQVGGTHYKQEYQHWDWVEETGMGYMEAQIARYVFRWREKDGIEGLQKAIHFVAKLVEMYSTLGRRNRAFNRNDILTHKMGRDRFAIGSVERSVFYALLHWDTLEDLSYIHKAIETLTNEPELPLGE